MPETLLSYRNSLPQSAAHIVDAQGQILTAWAEAGAGYVSLSAADKHTVTVADTMVEGTPTDVLQKEGWSPADVEVEDPEGVSKAWPDQWHRRWSQIFEYDVIAPRDDVQWLRDFVRGPERSDSLPNTWSEAKLTDGSGDHTHTLCSYQATVAVARGMAYVQRASSPVVMDKIQAGVGMVQRIAGIDAFSGWRSTSALPEARSEELYAPRDLYQLIDPRIYDPSTDVHSDDPRGEAFTTSDFLDARGLSQL